LEPPRKKANKYREIRGLLTFQPTLKLLGGNMGKKKGKFTKPIKKVIAGVSPCEIT